ncbi:major facilitator superfamily protein [Klebsormidium nitens]|uniref:Major facilitator superfamily protein n=1 Tax=Klebsormidium nitens TaxID=105231 RepID=A0A0U9HLR5_KLENI|nr:major facilitator superfamily protein [Klebsormidium nitens]|eukprot:GAQ77584.1 major facilitator superfamily protein [Klebsormidium nitens]
MQRSVAGGKADGSISGIATERAGMIGSKLERRNSSSSLSKGKTAVIMPDADNAASISATAASVGHKADSLREAALSFDGAIAPDPELNKIEEGSILDREPPKTASHMVKNTALCSFCFGMGMSVLFIHVGTTTLAAKEFQSTAAATLPFGLMLVVQTFLSLPVQYAKRRFGQKVLYVLGGLSGVLSGIIDITASVERSFILLCVGAIFAGAANSLVNFLRFEVTQFVHRKYISFAVSAVLGGGVIAGFTGPLVSRFTRHTFSVEFSCTYMLMTVMWLLEVAALCCIDFQSVSLARAHAALHKEDVRPLVKIVRQPPFLVALLAGAISFGIMAGMMVVVPVAMRAVQPGSRRVDTKGPADLVYDFSDTSLISIFHYEAMFLPSFFTGYIIKRMTAEGTMVAGFAFLLAGPAIFYANTSYIVFVFGFVSLGIAWNLAYVGATTLVASFSRAGEKEIVNGFNDMIVFGTTALLSSSASFILRAMNDWHMFSTLYIVIAVPAALVVIVFAVLRLSGRLGCTG